MNDETLQSLQSLNERLLEVKESVSRVEVSLDDCEPPSFSRSKSTHSTQQFPPPPPHHARSRSLGNVIEDLSPLEEGEPLSKAMGSKAEDMISLGGGDEGGERGKERELQRASSHVKPGTYDSELQVKLELALEYLLMKISSSPQLFNELIDENLHGVLQEIFDRERIQQIFFMDEGERGSKAKPGVMQAEALDQPLEAIQSSSDQPEDGPSPYEVAENPRYASLEQVEQLEEDKTGMREGAGRQQQPVPSSLPRPPSIPIPLPSVALSPDSVSAEADEWADDEDCGYVAVPISDKDFKALEEEMLRKNKMNISMARKEGRRRSESFKLDTISPSVASIPSQTTDSDHTPDPFISEGREGRRESNGDIEDGELYSSAYGSDYEEDLARAYDHLKLSLNPEGLGGVGGLLIGPMLPGDQGLEDERGGIRDSQPNLTDSQSFNVDPSSPTFSPVTGSMGDPSSPKSPDGSGIASAVWPRQPHQFAFSQENDGESDEVYSENDASLSAAADSISGEGHRPTLSEDKPDKARSKANSIDSSRSLSLYSTPPMEAPESSFTSSSNDYEVFHLKVVHRPFSTGFEESKDFKVSRGSVIAGRFKVVDFLGEAAFSTAYHCEDLELGIPVCIKVIKNNKDFFDQSLDEIKLLKYINSKGDSDKFHLLRLYDSFYFKEHLFIVTELLRDNLYEFSKYNRECGDSSYFNLSRLRKISRQCLVALRFIHSLNIIHSDLKPENILIKSYSRCEVKIIDFGSSCFTTDHMSSYIQSRSYRAPEVIFGAPYSQKIDIWSLGCIIAELYTGRVLFQNDSIQTLLARIVSIIGPFPENLMQRGREVPKLFTANQTLFEPSREGEGFVLLYPKKTSLRQRIKCQDDLFLDFLSKLLEIDPDRRPSAEEALRHPWLNVEDYE